MPNALGVIGSGINYLVRLHLKNIGKISGHFDVAEFYRDNEPIVKAPVARKKVEEKLLQKGQDLIRI